MSLYRFPRRFLPLLLLAFCGAYASAQENFWVDSEGNRHYGDRVEPNEQRWDAERLRESVPRRPEDYRQPGQQSDNCAAQRVAYERSAACFARCRTPTGNIANCGHCRQVEKPDC